MWYALLGIAFIGLWLGTSFLPINEIEDVPTMHPTDVGMRGELDGIEKRRYSDRSPNTAVTEVKTEET